FGLVYGELDATATVDVQSGAEIYAKNINLAAKNTAMLDINVFAVTIPQVGKQVGDTAIAISGAGVTSTATIASGAVVQVSDAVSISAVNENAFATNASALGYGGASAGLAVAVFTASTEATASNAANL